MPLLSDYNRNGAVDAADYTIWRKSMGDAGYQLAADGNGDGKVDSADYDVWRAHFGQAFHNGFGVASQLGNTVPEPNGLYVVLAVPAAILVRTRPMMKRCERESRDSRAAAHAIGIWSAALFAVLMIIGLGVALPGYAQRPAATSPKHSAKSAQPVADSAPAARPGGPRRGRVRIDGHSLVDDEGHFLGLGASYFTALWRCKNDRARLETDLEFLSQQGSNYYRMLSMVGYHPAWDGREIAPVSFANREGKHVEAWPDYWQQLRELIDLAYDRCGMRTQITIFADAQLMPSKEDRLEHMRQLLEDVVAGREHKIILLEVANEAWQNGFPGEQGISDLREFAAYLNSRTEIPIAITSNHDWPEPGSSRGFELIYGDGSADVATWHFSRDRGTHDGWKPVYDCWELADRPGFPPVSSNEPIGPGSSVNSEHEPIRLVMAAAFAYSAKLPTYVFHSEAGVFGKSRFEDMPGIDRFKHVLRLVPGDLASWQRNDGKEASAPFTVFAGGIPNRYWPEVESARDGCVRNIGSRKRGRFVCVPIGIRPEGLQLEAREPLEFTAYDPLTGEALKSASLQAGERITLPPGPGALLIIGHRAAR